MLSIISKPFHRIQKFVDSIGMYRMVSGSLGLLAFIAIVGGFTGYLAYSGLSQIFALTLALLVALVINYLVAIIFKFPTNHESAVITALILFFLVIPEESIWNSWPLVTAVAIGVLSKYIFTYKKQHFMNPAAVGAAALSVTGIYSISWWVANPVLFLPMSILGVLVVMKVRKWVPVLTFIAVSFTIYLAEAFSYGDTFGVAAPTFFISWPTLFLAFFMLTEPFTMPAKKEAQMLYGGLVGFLANSSLFALFVPMSPEFALIIANVVMTPWRLNQKLYLELIEKREIAKNTYEFIFKKPKGLNFKAGQYLEWMLPHEKTDSRGVRRYFTIASSPTESVVRLAFKVEEKGSSYKENLMDMDIGDKLICSQLAGDFLLPEKDSKEKLGFIAGGIGVTPFRSHLQYMQDSGKTHDTVLYYCNNTTADIAYKSDYIDYAESLPFILVQVLSREDLGPPYEYGYFNADMLKRQTPDYLERRWYISGPPGMVNACTATLTESGVKNNMIVKDFFPGLA